jgi:DNA polymerase-4
LIGVAITNLGPDLPRQLALPLEAEDREVLDGILDEIRDRFGSAAITRAVLLGRRPGLTMPLLPGDDAPGESEL